MKNILWGVCGISYGHLLRQKVLIDIVQSKGYNVQLFTFGTGLEFAKNNFKGINVYPVDVPWVCTGKDGIDFQSSLSMECNNHNFFANNFKQMGKAVKNFQGEIDLIISDYEPVSAQLAYATNAKLVTIDQQSKFLFLNEEIDGFSSKEESSRLNFFFPTCHKRVVCSFFNIVLETNEQNVILLPPFIRNEIKELRVKRNQRKIQKKKSILVYESSFMARRESEEDVVEVLGNFPNYTFTIFTPRVERYREVLRNERISNVIVEPISNKIFLDVLEESEGVISTAGHNFLSELMFLGIPVYTLPLPAFEQIKSASIIEKGEFGVKEKELSTKGLKVFLSNLDVYRNNIAKDTSILMRGSGEVKAVEYIESIFEK